MTDDRELEFSPLGGRVTREGTTVDVKIYRSAGTEEHWQLEVVDQEGVSTVWDDPFPTDQEAYRVFYKTLEAEGIRTFLEDKPRDGVLH